MYLSGLAISLEDEGFCTLLLVPEKEIRCAQRDPADDPTESLLPHLLFTPLGGGGSDHISP